jgi:hypothetical protein
MKKPMTGYYKTVGSYTNNYSGNNKNENKANNNYYLNKVPEAI